MMKNNNFDQGVMVDAIHMLRVWILLHKASHLINVSKQKVWEVQHFHPCKVHEETDVVSVQPGKSTLTSEIFDDDPHQGDIPVLKKFEREKPLHLTSMLRFNVRLIIMLIKILSLIPLLTNIWNPSGI